MTGRKREGNLGTVAVAMSGGVDSSLTALLLAERGYSVLGFTLHLHDEGERGGSEQASRSRCCGTADSAARARQAALKAGGRHQVIDARLEFEKEVIEDFESEYAMGRTPNPCIRCNTYLKWGFLLERAEELGADFFATGHHARITTEADGSHVLRSAADRAKDQGYALWGIPRPLLSRTLLPIGDLQKSEVRRLAARYGLAAADMPDSQEICFIVDDDYPSFLERRVRTQVEGELASALAPGDIVDADGNVLGRHEGIARYTIGQRHGLRIAAGRPLYVEKLESATGRVVLGDGSGLLSTSLRAEGANWVSIDPPADPFRAQVGIRYSSEPAHALVTPESGDAFRIEFDEVQRAITPGQSAVVYDGEIVLGGGVISG